MITGKQTLVRKIIPSKNDPFGFAEGKTSIIFYCRSLKELREKLRALTPRGYRIPSYKTLSRIIKSYPAPIQMKNPLLGTLMYEIVPIKEKPETKSVELISQAWDVYTNEQVIS